jgi:CO/xanthine dehydrogenase Mo-binding subunit
VLGVPIEKIDVVSHFLGGGFGGKGYVWPHTLLAALAARVLNTDLCAYSSPAHRCIRWQAISRRPSRRSR